MFPNHGADLFLLVSYIYDNRSSQYRFIQSIAHIEDRIKSPVTSTIRHIMIYAQKTSVMLSMKRVIAFHVQLII